MCLFTFPHFWHPDAPLQEMRNQPVSTAHFSSWGLGSDCCCLWCWDKGFVAHVTNHECLSSWCSGEPKSVVWRRQSRNVTPPAVTCCRGEVYMCFLLPRWWFRVEWDAVGLWSVLVLDDVLEQVCFWHSEVACEVLGQESGILGNSFKKSLSTPGFKRLLWDPVTKWGTSGGCHWKGTCFLSAAASLALMGMAPGLLWRREPTDGNPLYKML